MAHIVRRGAASIFIPDRQNRLSNLHQFCHTLQIRPEFWGQVMVNFRKTGTTKPDFAMIGLYFLKMQGMKRKR